MNKKLEEFGDMKILEIMGLDGISVTYTREEMRQIIMSIASGLKEAEVKGIKKGFTIGIGCGIVAYGINKLYKTHVKEQQVESK